MDENENTNESLSVLVTGATEGLGREIIRQLVAQGYQANGIVDTLDEANQIRADGGLPVYCDIFRAGSIASAVKMAEVDVVINAAPQYINGLPLHKPDWDHYMRLVNEGAAAVAQGAAQGGASFVVHTSAAFVYGSGVMLDESAAVDSHNILSAAAAAGETAVLTGETPACVLRAGFNYGPGTASLNALHRALMNRGMLDLGDQETAMSWVHEGDLARAAILAAQQQPAGEVFNVAAADNHSPLAFANAFAESLGVPPPRPANMPAFLRDWTSNATSRALIENGVTVDSTKLRKALGWEPEYETVARGLEQTLLAWRAAQVV